MTTFNFGKSKTAKKANVLSASRQGPDPLADVEYTDPPDLAEDSIRELDALSKGFRERKGNEDARFRDATDSEYWFAVCFRSRAHKDAFLAAVRKAKLGSGRLQGDKYLDGHQLAKLLGIEIEPPDVET